MPENIAEMMEFAQQSLLALNAKVGSPRDYFAGRRVAETALPDNIILFARRPGHSLNFRDFKDFHYRHVLVVPLRGQGRVVVNARSFSLSPGRCLLVRPYQFHHYTNVDTDNIEWLFISFEGLTNIEGLPSMVRLRSVQFWSDLLSLVQTYLEPPTENTARQLALRLMLLLTKMQGQRALDPHTPSQVSAEEDLLMRIHSLMAGRMQKSLSVKEVSEALGISESHLRSRFRETVKRSLGSYMRIMRLRYAAGLLSRQEMSVGEVATASGWESPFSFSRAFAAYWGVAPRDFVKLGAMRMPLSPSGPQYDVPGLEEDLSRKVKVWQRQEAEAAAKRQRAKDARSTQADKNKVIAKSKPRGSEA